MSGTRSHNYYRMDNVEHSVVHVTDNYSIRYSVSSHYVSNRGRSGRELKMTKTIFYSATGAPWSEVYWIKWNLDSTGDEKKDK